jgi:hypothetical protein
LFQIDVAMRMRERLPINQQEKLRFEYRSVIDGIPDEQFDVVSMIDVLHHIQPKYQEKAIADVLPHIKRGGYFVYKDMASKPFLCGLMNRLHDLASAKQWIHYCPISKVEFAVKIGEGGLEKWILQEFSNCRLYWYQHEWMIFKKE